MSIYVEWLLNLYATLKHKFSYKGYWLDCPIVVSTRKVIMQFCFLIGTRFSSYKEQMQEHQKNCLLDTLEENKHPVITSCSIIKFVRQYLNPEMRLSIFSPQLIEVDLPNDTMTLGTNAIVIGLLAKLFESISFFKCVTRNKIKFVEDVLTKIEDHSNSLTLNILVECTNDNSSGIEMTTFLHKAILLCSIALFLIPTLRARWFSLGRVLLGSLEWHNNTN